MQSLINRRRTYYHHNEFEHNWLRLIPEADNATLTFTIHADVSTTNLEYIEYSKDAGKTWVRTNNVDSTAVTITVANVRQERAVCFRGKGVRTAASSEKGSPFASSASYRVEGDIRSLLYLDDFANKSIPNDGFCGLFKNSTNLISAADLNIDATSIGSWSCNAMFEGCTSLLSTPDLPCTSLADHCYRRMFYGCTSLISAPRILPATTLYDNIYERMFDYCSSLVSAPNLSATTLASGSCSSMFKGCTSLVNAPTLPATTVTYYCYDNMFNNCTSLITAPALPATTLAEGCYRAMFQGCTSLVNVPNLPGTLKKDCYREMFKGCSSLTSTPTLSKTTLQESCYRDMFNGCTALTTVTTLPATTLKAKCYQDMFNGCTALVTAPVLPATTLVDSCYNGMFVNCSSLNYIKAMFTTTPSTSYTWNWVAGSLPSTGIFIKNPNANWVVTGDNGVPTGWNEAFEVEYIQSTGIQYINTGITNTLDTELYVDFQLTGGTSEDRKIIGQGFKFGFGQYESKWRIVDDKWYKTSVSTDTSRHVFSTDGGKYYLDSTLLADRYSHKAAGTYPMLLFAVSSQNSASPDGNCAKMKLYGCRIYEGNSLVRDFVPIAMDDGDVDLTGYMYDKVSCSVFSNAGSGYFTIGPTV